MNPTDEQAPNSYCETRETAGCLIVIVIMRVCVTFDSLRLVMKF